MNIREKKVRCCQRKVRYSDPISAMRKFIDMARLGLATFLRLYYCDICGGFHLGNARPRTTVWGEQLAGRAIIQRLVKRLAKANGAPQ